MRWWARRRRDRQRAKPPALRAAQRRQQIRRLRIRPARSLVRSSCARLRIAVRTALDVVGQNISDEIGHWPPVLTRRYLEGMAQRRLKAQHDLLAQLGLL